jgi:integrin alpha FG-GAP repeat containing protein 1
MKKYFFVFFLLISLYDVIFGLKIYDSMKSIPSATSGFYTFKLGLENNCKPLYYVDLNSDKLNDIIASCKTSNGDSKISYYIYNEKEKNFELNNDYNKNGLIISDYEIISFVANDINKDGYLDFIMTLKKNKKYESRIYVYNKDGGTYELVFKSNNDDQTQNLFVADIGSKRVLKIIYYDYSESKRKVFYYDELDKKFITKDFIEFLSNNNKICDGNEKYSKVPFESPNTNAFIDIDGDCLNDIIISSYDNQNKKRKLEIWKGVFEDEEVKYCLSSNNIYDIDDSLGLFTVVDVDRNALPDLVFPILNTSPPQILVAYNIISMSYTWTSDYCTDHPPINFNKSPNSEIKKIFENFNVKVSNKNNYIMNIHDNKNYMFYSDNKDFPLILRFIDVNQDSYPDFVTILYDKSAKSKKLIIYLSQQIEKGDTDRRFFSQKNIYDLTSNYESNYDIIVSSFFDFEDNRKMGLIIYDQKGVSLGLYNNNVYDTYTLKSTLLFKKDCFFCTEYGSSQRFITTNINGNRRMDLSLQNPQVNAPGILSLTYAYLGIGRSNNYIENFHIISGNAYKRDDNDKTYTPVIPNSQLIIYHDNIPSGNKTTWQVDLVVKPTKYLYQLIIVIIAVIIVLTFISTRLLLKEREEDYMENKETFAPWFG